MDAAQFHSNYDAFPDALMLLTADGWLTNPAADALCLSETDLSQLAAWDADGSVWLAGRFLFVRGHRTPDGLFLILQPDAFMSSSVLKLSDQLRRHLALAFAGLNSATQQLDDQSKQTADQNLSAVNRALHQLLRMATELDSCAADNLTCNLRPIDLLHWSRHISDELHRWCGYADNATLTVDLPSASLCVMADPYLLDCLVAHLVSNAIKSAPAGSNTAITFSVKAQGPLATIVIQSSGGTFSPAVLTDPVWNQPVTLRPDQGLGLGLPIAQRVAALHGGTLVAAPAKTGTQAVFSVPMIGPGHLLASPSPPVELAGGFSIVRIILSDALPSSAFSLLADASDDPDGN